MKMKIHQRGRNQLRQLDLNFLCFLPIETMRLPIPIPNPQNLSWSWVFLISSIFFYTSMSDPRNSTAGLYCENSISNASTPNFIPNFVQVMEVISERVAEEQWGSHYIISPPPEVYGLAQCYGDLSPTDCQLCFADGRTKLPRCLTSTSARIYLDGCFLRYDNYSFFNEFLDPGPASDKVKCGAATGVLMDSYLKMRFLDKVDEVLMNVTEKAAINGGFSVVTNKGGIIGVYALAQCWKTIDEKGCRECLLNAGLRVRKCVPGSDGRAMNAGCYLRYSTKPFFSENAEKKAHFDSARKKMIVAIILSAIAFSMLACFGTFLGYKRLSKKREGQKNYSQISSSASYSNLHFKYEVLEKATDFFDDSKKIGQGGAGSVFMGTLPDGRNVAVKRLFFNTRQWVDEFFNEVNLINGIQHKNLVRLLGCSIEGPESLLVYEFVPNRSLDRFLFVKNTIHILSWQQRFEIISGTAEGLAYLHAGSEVKIIHRDIKSSNVLLDQNLTPKIADFGLVRCLSADKSHISTGIAGTLGYMAPEYLVRGQLSEKADVYAFGVLALEIVCGKKNTVFTQGSSSILHSVWKHYKLKCLPESVDPGLQGRFSKEDAANVLQIGLLCTQASAALRPSMSEVVQMLSNKDCAIPVPQQPPFLNASVLSPDDSTHSFISDSSALKGHTLADTSSSTNTSKSSIIHLPKSNVSSTSEVSEPD